MLAAHPVQGVGELRELALQEVEDAVLVVVMGVERAAEAEAVAGELPPESRRRGAQALAPLGPAERRMFVETLAAYENGLADPEGWANRA